MNRVTPSAPALCTLLAALLLAGALPATAQQEQAPTRLVQISLLAVSKTGANELSDLPANARQAIEDIQEFLPFKSYRLLDTALVRTSRGARTKLRGPDNGEFQVTMDFHPSLQDGKLQVIRFELLDQRDSPARIARDLAESAGQQPMLAPRAPSGPVISTSFNAEIGQTVVVGSSRLDGGEEALMVLFTALP